ncbi:MAG TPA: aspartate-semialdehyde dehydrogenase [Gammaproteobacteria bacterium]|nr:aspartate-semialdehyde dehydrogenase [Gammaproteobacteria bacterium]
MSASFNVAVVGTTGVVGTMLLSILEERDFPIKKIYLVASQRSAGDTKDFKNKPYLIDDITTFDFSNTEICFFCTGNDISEKYAPIAAAAGNIVIDKSAYFRYDAAVPLIVPEVNSKALVGFRNKNIIANPNCNTIPLVMALKPIYDAVGISRMNIATYQSVSGSGKEAITELFEQTAQLLNGKPIKPKVYPQQIAFNVLPHIDDFQENGYTKEEMKIIWETQKIFDDKTIAINPTAVRVPVFYGHSAAVHLETKQKISVKDATKLISKMPGVKISSGKYPYSTPTHDAAGADAVFVGRLREDLSHKNGLNCWVVADNLRKGAALNAVQIAEELIRHYL